MTSPELIIDNFAGGGGASTGIELATGRPVDIAINHDPAAITMHTVNHPHTTHFCESVWDVDPRKVTKGRQVGLVWFSPDCKHFSKAKGGKPVNKEIRGLAWVAVRWAATVRQQVINTEMKKGGEGVTVKEYLSQAFVLRKLINAKESRIQDLRERQQSLGGALSDVKVQTSIAQDPLGEITALLLDLINECRRDIERLLSIQKEIEVVIEKVERSDLRLVLYERYVNLKRWEDIASDNGYSWNWVHTLHRRGLEAVKEGIETHTLDVV